MDPNDNVIGPVEPLNPPVIFRFRTYNTTVVFIIVTLAILIAWLLVALWTRTIENLAYNTLGLDSNSFWHALIIAGSITIIFFATVWVVDQYGLVPGGLEPVVSNVGQPVIQRRGGSAVNENTRDTNPVV